MPNCISNPSFVVCRSGMAITPALLTRMSRGLDEDEKRLAKDPTLSRDARSKGIAATCHGARAKEIQSLRGDRRLFKERRRMSSERRGKHSGHVSFTYVCTTISGATPELRIKPRQPGKKDVHSRLSLPPLSL